MVVASKFVGVEHPQVVIFGVREGLHGVEVSALSAAVLTSGRARLTVRSHGWEVLGVQVADPLLGPATPVRSRGFKQRVTVLTASAVLQAVAAAVQAQPPREGPPLLTWLASAGKSSSSGAVIWW